MTGRYAQILGPRSIIMLMNSMYFFCIFDGNKSEQGTTQTEWNVFNGNWPGMCLPSRPEEKKIVSQRQKNHIFPQPFYKARAFDVTISHLHYQESLIRGRNSAVQ